MPVSLQRFSLVKIKTAHVYAISGRLLSYAGTLLLLITLPAVLSPDLFAEYSLIWPIGILTSTLLMGWMNGFAFRKGQELIGSDGETLRNELAGFYFGSMILCTLAFLVLLELEVGWPLLIPGIAFFSGLKDLVIKVATSTQNYLLFVGLQLVNLLGKIVAIGFVWYMNLNEIEVVLSLLVLTEVITIIPALRFMKKIKVTYNSLTEYKLITEGFRYGVPLLASSLGVWIISLSDRYVLSLFNDKSEIASYVIATQFSGNAILIPLTCLITIIYPTLIKIEKESGLSNAMTLNKFYINKYILLAPILGLIMIASLTLVLPILYKKYDVSIFVICVSIISHVIYGLSQFLNKEFELSGQTTVITKSVGLGAAVNLLGNFALVPFLGQIGAISSTLVAYSTVTLSIAWQSQYCNGKH